MRRRNIKCWPFMIALVIVPWWGDAIAQEMGPAELLSPQTLFSELTKKRCPGGFAFSMSQDTVYCLKTGIELPTGKVTPLCDTTLERVHADHAFARFLDRLMRTMGDALDRGEAVVANYHALLESDDPDDIESMNTLLRLVDNATEKDMRDAVSDDFPIDEALKMRRIMVKRKKEEGLSYREQLRGDPVQVAYQWKASMKNRQYRCPPGAVLQKEKSSHRCIFKLESISGVNKMRSYCHYISKGYLGVSYRP